MSIHAHPIPNSRPPWRWRLKRLHCRLTGHVPKSGYAHLNRVAFAFDLCERCGEVVQVEAKK